MIRFATPEDFPRLRELMQLNGMCIDGVAYDHFSAPCLVYVREGEVIGFMQALIGAPYAVVTEMVIAPEHQRKGYAARLLEHMETVMRSVGVKTWAAFTAKKNEAFAAQLDRIGCQRTGEGLGFVRVLA